MDLSNVQASAFQSKMPYYNALWYGILCQQQVNKRSLTSDMDASITPPITGTRDAMTQGLGTSPRNKALSTTLNAGSIACDEQQRQQLAGSATDVLF